MTEIQLHRCRFMDYSRPNISALAFNMASQGLNALPSPDLRLAVGRSNGDIEVWNPQPNWHLETVLYGAKDRSIEDLAWCMPTDDSPMRLFSVGASDSITEWDLETGTPIGQFRADAGVIWALELSPSGNELAVACETGTIVIFDISGGKGSVEFSKRLQKADASLASLTWLGQDLIIAGSSDARVRAWSVSSARIVGTMKVDKSKGDDQTFVWSVQRLRNGEQFASGDSNGFIKIWDSKTLAMQQSFQAHPNDVLCMAVDAAGETLFSSGLDQKIVSLKMTDTKHKRWTAMSSQVAQSHDIRCIAAYEARGASYLVTGGLERTLAINSVTQFNQKSARKIPLTRYRPTVEIASQRLIIEWREQTARVWKLDGEKRRLLVEVTTGKGDDYITSASISPESELLALATTTDVKVFSIDGLKSAKVTAVTKLDIPQLDKLGGFSHIKFTNKNTLALVTSESELYLFNTDSHDLNEIESPDAKHSSAIPYYNTVSLIAASNTGKFLALAKHNRYVDIYDLSKKTYLGTPPAVAENITAISFTKQDTLVVASVDQDVFEFDTKTLALTSWSREHSGRLPLQLSKQNTPCCGLFNDPVTSSRIWLWGPSWLAYLDFATTQPYRKSAKRRAGGEEAVEEPDAEEDKTRTFWLTSKFRPIFYAGALGKEIMISEKPPIQADEIKPFWSNRHINI